MLGRVTSLLVADEIFVVPHVLRSFTGREIDFVNVHGVRVLGGLGGSSILSQWDIANSSTSEFPEFYHIPVELSSCVKPLFPFPISLFLSIRESCGSHRDG